MSELASDSVAVNEAEYRRIFPDGSKKLEAYAMAFDDLAVFEAAGHSREAIGKLTAYGFVNFSGMQSLLQSAMSRLCPGSGSLAEALDGIRFLDLGSGEGRAVIGAALLSPGLAEAAGVELSVSRHELALKNRELLAEETRSCVRFVQCDILATDLEQLAAADVIWVSNLHFPDDVTDAIGELLERECAPDKDVVVTSLRECHFQRPHESWTEQVSMSWNPGGWPVFCYLVRSRA